jgi:hypothetical protein
MAEHTSGQVAKNQAALTASEAADLIRHAGLILINITLYGLWHRATRELAHETFQQVTALLARCGQLDVQLEPQLVRVNGVRVGRNNPAVQAFATHLLNRDISRFALLQGLTEAQFDKLLEVLGTESQMLEEQGGFSQSVQALGLGEHVNEVESAVADESLVASVPPVLPEEVCAPAAAPYDQQDKYGGDPDKVTDFLLGFFGISSLQVVGSIMLFNALKMDIDRSGLLLPGMVELGVVIVVTWHFFAIRRRFISIGYLWAVGIIISIPLLLLGACFLVLSGIKK